jgi:predicted nucleic acid-binding protein
VILLDTNVLVYSVNSAVPQHVESRRLLQLCTGGTVPGVVVPQVLLEFYATTTSERRVRSPLTPKQASAEIDGFCRRLTLKPVPGDVISHLLSIVSTQPRTGQSIFDLFLIAQMRSHGIGDVCTYNVADFAFPGIRALEPQQLLALYPTGP